MAIYPVPLPAGYSSVSHLVYIAVFVVAFLYSGSLWCSQDLNVSLLPLVFSLILTVASILLHLYSTSDKTSRLKMKSFSTVSDTLRGSRSYMEKRRGSRASEVTRMR